MAFQEFNEYGGGGPFMPQLRLWAYEAVDMEIIARMLRDQGTVEGYAVETKRFLTPQFDPLTFERPASCDFVAVSNFDGSVSYGTYAYGDLIPEYEGLAYIDKLEKEYGVDIPLEHAVMPWMIRFGKTKLNPLVDGIAAVIKTDEYGNRDYAWKHPTLRGFGFNP